MSIEEEFDSQFVEAVYQEEFENQFMEAVYQEEFENEFLEAVYLSLLPSDTEERNLSSLVQRLESGLLKQWPEATLKIYGSYGAGISLRGSDIDSTLMVDLGFQSPQETLMQIAEILTENGFVNIQPQLWRKLPMIVAEDKISGTRLDITLNNPEPVKHAELTKALLDTIPGVKKFLILLKFWSNVQCLTKSKGRLASLGFNSIGIFFLQYKKIIPIFLGQDGKRLSYEDLVLKGSKLRKIHSLKDMLKEFFEFFGNEFKYAKSAISTRVGGILNKSDLGWADRKVENNGIVRYYFCIEDPFDTQINIGLSLEKREQQLMILSFQAAFELICNEKIGSLFEPHEVIMEIRQKEAAFSVVKNQRRKEQRNRKEDVDRSFL